MQGIYQQPDMTDFSARPKVVAKKGKYREEREEKKGQQNLMYDRRVIRGNTYASITLSKSSDPLLVEKQQARLQEKAYPAQHSKKLQEGGSLPAPPVAPQEGREEMAVQTEEYVEMLSDRLQEKEIEIQTDFYLDRPSNNRFRVKMEGTSVETQIEKGDIFDFDEEVEPILGMLCTKVIEQSRMEVLEEQELAVMKAQLREFEQKVRAQRQEMQRLAEIERRKKEEAERRQTQHSLQLANQKDTQKKVLDRLSAKALLASLVPKQVGQLQSLGLFNSQAAMLEDYHSWLIDHTDQVHEHNTLNLREQLRTQREVQGKLQNRQRAAMDAQQLLEDQAEDKRLAKEEQRRLAREERDRQKLKQQRMEQREAFKNQVEVYLKQAELKKENVLAQTFTDVSFPGNTVPVVGMLGTVVGEAVFTMGALHQLLSGEPTEVLQVMQTALKENPRIFLEQLEVFLETVFMKDASVVLPVSNETERALQLALNEENLRLESLDTVVTAENIGLVSRVVGDNLESIAYEQLVRKNVAGLDAEFVVQVVESVLRVLLKAELLQQKKVRLQPMEKTEQFSEEFALKLSPLDDELNQSANQDNSQSILLFDDKVTLCAHSVLDTPLLVYQYIPTIMFRKQLVKAIVNKIAKKFAVAKIEKSLLPGINRKAGRLFEDMVSRWVKKDEQLENPFFMEFEMQ